MSTSHLRLVAAGLSLIVAVLAGVLSGFVGSEVVCRSEAGPQPAPSVVPTSARPSLPGSATGTPTDTPAEGGRPQTEPESPGPQTQPEAVTNCRESFSAASAMVGFGGAVLAALVAAGVAMVPTRPGPLAPTGAHAAPHRMAARQPAAVASVAVPVSGAGAAPPLGMTSADRAVGADSAAEKDRATLVQTCIYVRDRSTSKAIAERLGWALREVGVTELAPTGVTFDPAHHEAGGAVDTEDPRQAGTVAAVEITGYADRGKVLRAPVVTVYRRAGQ